jgi:hypothetical protein
MFGLKIDIVLSMLRHVLTTLGGALITAGYISSGNLEAAIGALVTIVGLAYAIAHHTLANDTALPSDVVTTRPDTAH